MTGKLQDIEYLLVTKLTMVKIHRYLLLITQEIYYL